MNSIMNLLFSLKRRSIDWLMELAVGVEETESRQPLLKARGKLRPTLQDRKSQLLFRPPIAFLKSGLNLF